MITALHASRTTTFPGIAMSMSFAEDVKSVQELVNSPHEILDQVHRTGRPVVIAESHKPAVVILEATQFERMIKAINMARLLAKSEEDVREGRVRPLEEFIQEMEREHKVPSQDRPKRRA
jgi:PHD/YefM family antitoxin component YafN of YafNO toxin-antitoxin module